VNTKTQRRARGADDFIIARRLLALGAVPVASCPKWGLARDNARKHRRDRLWPRFSARYDNETCRLEPIDNPFGPKVLPMSPE